MIIQLRQKFTLLLIIHMKYHHHWENATKLWKIPSFSLHLNFLLNYLLNFHFLQTVMITWYHSFRKIISSLKHNWLLSICILVTIHSVYMTKIKNFSHPFVQKMYPYQNWLDNGVKIFSLKFSFLRPSLYGLKTDESDPSFLPVSQKASHHQTYTNLLQHTKPHIHIFVYYKYTSPYTLTNLLTIDNGRITRYLRNYDRIKQYFCLLLYNDTSRPLIVPQEYTIYIDVFCCLATFLLKLWNLSQLRNILFLLHLGKETHHIKPLFLNNRISTTNCSLFPPDLDSPDFISAHST